MDYFKKMINICKQMNYSKFKSEEYDKFYKQLQELVAERKVWEFNCYIICNLALQTQVHEVKLQVGNRKTSSGDLDSK